MISLDRAQKLIYQHTLAYRKNNILKTEEVDIKQSVGRITSSSILATINNQSFRSSAMDGYAVRFLDFAKFEKTNTPLKLEVIGIKPAAISKSEFALKKNQAVKVFTGAHMPKGADAVLIVENVKVLDSGYIQPTKMVVQNQYIREIGNDYKKKSLLIKTNKKITPYDQVLIASSGIKKIQVYKQAKAKIIPLGSELINPGKILKLGQVYASSQFGLSSLVSKYGLDYSFENIISDKQDLIKKALTKKNVDIIITTGSASKGDYDYLPQILKEGMIFHKINLKPGKPAIFSKLGSNLVLSLPGNPVSSLVVLNLLLPFLIAGLYNQDIPKQIYKTAIYKGRSYRSFDRETFLSAQVEIVSNKKIIRPLKNQDSSCVSSLAKANCLLNIKPNFEIKNNQEVKYLDLL